VLENKQEKTYAVIEWGKLARSQGWKREKPERSYYYL